MYYPYLTCTRTWPCNLNLKEFRMQSLKYLVASLFITAGSVASAGSQLTLTSEPGDYIGQGQNAVYTDTGTAFKYSTNFDNGITVAITNANTWWTLNLAAPGNARIQPGVYEQAARFPFQPADKPGLDFSGNGRGCNTLTGKFKVNAVTYEADGTLSSLSATFEQHCEGNVAALHGAINYNLEPPMGVDVNGINTLIASCHNRTTGQRLRFKTNSVSIDCKKQGLDVRTNDEVVITLYGKAQ